MNNSKVFKTSIIRVLITSVLSLIPLSSNGAMILTWDWDMPTRTVNSNETIEMWATLNLDVNSTNDLTLPLFGASIVTSSLIDNSRGDGSWSSRNPYLFEMGSTFVSDMQFSFQNPFQLGESMRFLYGTLTPKANIAPGTYSTTNIDLSFNGTLFSRVESDFVVTVSAVPLPASFLLLLSGFIGLIGFAKRKV